MVVFAGLIILLVVGIRQCGRLGEGLLGGGGETAITQSTVLSRVESVAKLVSTEATLRDVVVYENTWYGSTKRSIVVVTARVLAGFDLNAAMDVDINDAERTIVITLPPASILAIDVTDLKTYDEQGGLWNPFTPADRDTIFSRVREQLTDAAQELDLAEHANESAEELLETMFSVEGWRAEVAFAEPLPPLDR
ncbi:MAG: DUF4230 domain-containing protein [Gemmatimonadaceae bacterium]